MTALITHRLGIAWAISILSKSFASEPALAIILEDKLKGKIYGSTK